MPNGNERATIDSFFLNFKIIWSRLGCLYFCIKLISCFPFHHIFFSSPWFYLCIKRKAKNQMETWNSKINVSTFFLFSNAYLIIIVYRLFFYFLFTVDLPILMPPLLPICPFSYDVLVPPFWSEYIYWISQLEKKDKMVENFISNTVDSWYPI